MVLGVAIDDIGAIDEVRVEHPPGSKGSGFLHRVFHGGQRMMHWFDTGDGWQSCAFEDGMIVRVAKDSSPPDPASLWRARR